MIAQLFDKAPCGFISFYEDGTIMQVNETLGTILKVDTASLKGKNVESLFTFFPAVTNAGSCRRNFSYIIKQ